MKRILVVLAALSLAAVLAACGKHEHGGKRASSDDTVIQIIRADVEQPVNFVIANAVACVGASQNQISASPGEGVQGARYLTMPDDRTLVAIIIAPLYGRLFVDPNCSPTAAFKALGSGDNGDLYYQHRVYSLGAFHLDDISFVNEFEGTDRGTGSMTKFRSYRDTVSFQPSDALRRAAPDVSFSTIHCTLAFKLNQMTLKWEYAEHQCLLQ